MPRKSKAILEVEAQVQDLLKLLNQLKQTERVANKTARAFGVMGERSRVANAGLDRYGKAAQRARMRTQQLANSFNLVRAAMVALPVVVAAQGMRALGRQAIALDRAMLGVEKTTGLSGEALSQYRTQLIGLSNDIGVSVEQLAQLSENAGALGVQGAQNLERFTRKVSALVVSTDLGVDNASNTLARLINLTGVDFTEGVDQASSALGFLEDNIAATGSEIASAIDLIAPKIINFTRSTADIIALAGTSAAAGQRASTVGTAFQTVFENLERAIDEGNESFKAIAETMNLSVDEAVAAYRQDRVLFTAQLSERLNDFSSTQQTALLEGLGSIGRETRAAFVSLGPQLVRNLRLSRQGEGLDYTTRQQELITQSLSGRFDQAIEQTENAFIKLGDEILPSVILALEAFAGGLSDATESVASEIGRRRAERLQEELGGRFVDPDPLAINQEVQQLPGFQFPPQIQAELERQFLRDGVWDFSGASSTLQTQLLEYIDTFRRTGRALVQQEKILEGLNMDLMEVQSQLPEFQRDPPTLLQLFGEGRGVPFNQGFREQMREELLRSADISQLGPDAAAALAFARESGVGQQFWSPDIPWGGIGQVTGVGAIATAAGRAGAGFDSTLANRNNVLRNIINDTEAGTMVGIRNPVNGRIAITPNSFMDRDPGFTGRMLDRGYSFLPREELLGHLRNEASEASARLGWSRAGNRLLGGAGFGLLGWEAWRSTQTSLRQQQANLQGVIPARRARFDVERRRMQQLLGDRELGIEGSLGIANTRPVPSLSGYTNAVDAYRAQANLDRREQRRLSNLGAGSSLRDVSTALGGDSGLSDAWTPFAERVRMDVNDFTMDMERFSRVGRNAFMEQTALRKQEEAEELERLEEERERREELREYAINRHRELLNQMRQREEYENRFYMDAGQRADSLAEAFGAAMGRVINEVHGFPEVWDAVLAQMRNDLYNTFLRGHVEEFGRNLFGNIVNDGIDAITGAFGGGAGGGGNPYSHIPGGGPSGGSVPRAATGGDVRRAGLVMVGERGAELVSLPAGARVHPHGTGGGVAYNFYGTGIDEAGVRRVAEEVVQGSYGAFRDGLTADLRRNSTYAQAAGVR